jgi:hypothetical protein
VIFKVTRFEDKDLWFAEPPAYKSQNCIGKWGEFDEEQVHGRVNSLLEPILNFLLLTSGQVMTFHSG